MRAAPALISTMSACALLALATPGTPCLVWNATASAPTGLYLVVSARSIRRGDLVLAFPPRYAQELAAQRGYLPFGVPLVKHIAAVGGDRICGHRKSIAINGRFAVFRLNTDSLHRPLPTWNGCRTLAHSEALLLNADVTHSFDGRYFGPIPTAAILGKLVPLWTR